MTWLDGLLVLALVVLAVLEVVAVCIAILWALS